MNCFCCKFQYLADLVQDSTHPAVQLLLADEFAIDLIMFHQMRHEKDAARPKRREAWCMEVVFPVLVVGTTADMNTVRLRSW